MATRRLSSETLLKFVRVARKPDALPELKELRDAIRIDPRAASHALARQQTSAFIALSGYIDALEANALRPDLNRARERAWSALAVWTNEEGGA
jgi:hypothetical protein